MAERTVSDGHFEMLWDCEFCDAKGLLGKSQRHCAECGAPQNPDKRYFPKEGEAQRVDGHQYEGADRHCPACKTPQSAKAHNCTHCGSPLDGAQEVRGVVTPVAPPKPRRWWILVVVLLVIAAIGFGIWYRFIRTRSEQMTVTQHRWERAIAVERYAELEESNWRDHVPADARGRSCFQKQRSTKQVPTGEEKCTTKRKDKKDGTFEQVRTCKPVTRSEPVHDDWCRYTVRRWEQLAPVKASGTGTSPAWPTEGLPPAEAAPALGARRQGKRTERLILDLGTQSCDVSEAVWKKYADGAKAKVEVRASSGDLVCSSL